MPARKPESPPEDDAEQSRRFIDMTPREVEADETPGALDRALDKIIRPKDAAPDHASPDQVDYELFVQTARRLEVDESTDALDQHFNV